MTETINDSSIQDVSSFFIKPWQGNEIFGWSKSVMPQPLSLAEQIAGTVGEKILQGEYSPGQRIPEQLLSEAFHVSRGPVREALMLLATERLVIIEPRRGARVTQLSSEEVEEIFIIRASLVGLASRLFAQKAEKNMLGEFEKAARYLIKIAGEDTDPDTYVRWSYALSLYTAKYAGLPRLFEMINSTAREAYRYARMSLESKERRLESCDAWANIIELVKNRRLDEVEKASRAIVEKTGQAALLYLK
ncbi:GntR family transcriptional regulator [bacterium]|nr:GntR family transcriptional regulator [bacterium]